VRILIGLDGSPEAAAGVDFVRRLTLSPSDEIVVATVVEIPSGLLALTGPQTLMAWYDHLRSAVTSDCRAIADDAVRSLAGHGRASSVVVEGHPLEMLQALARERAVDLVVVGPHGRGRLESALVGSVSQGLLHTPRTSTLVARAIRHDLRSVILAVDGSAHSRAAARLLAKLPLPAGTTVLCTTVVPNGGGPYGRAWSDEAWPIVQAKQQAAADRALDEAESELRPGRLDVRREIRSGIPKQAILEAAGEHESDLIVMGARGLGGFEALVIGSVSRAVSKAAPCSVLVAHAA
jgi:nucleotide-binding universal stress UspA family protein